MRGVLAVTLQSMQNDMKRVDLVGNNLANATTPGYKREMLLERPFVEMMEQAGNMTAASYGGEWQGIATQIVTDKRAGMLKATGQKLDVALGGEGYFQVETKDGLAYTRQGGFQLDARGRLVNAQGNAVMGKTGEIYLKTSNPVIDESGNIRDGNAENHGTVMSDQILAQIKVVNFKEVKGLHKIGDGLVIAKENAEYTDVINPMIKQGHIENSNISSVEEMVQLMQTMRHFESMQKITQGYDEMLGTAIRKLGDL